MILLNFMPEFSSVTPHQTKWIMKTTTSSKADRQSKKLTAQQIRFRQHANKIKKAWPLKPERIQQAIEKILDEYADKQMEQHLILVYLELTFAIYRKTIIGEGQLKYDLILRWVRQRRTEVLADNNFQVVRIKWEDKYWATPSIKIQSIQDAVKIITRNLTVGTPGDNNKLEKLKIYSWLAKGIFPDTDKYAQVDIAEVLSGMKALEYFGQELLKLDPTLPSLGQAPTNLNIQVKHKQENEDEFDPDDLLAINIPMNKITRAFKENMEPVVDKPKNDLPQHPALEIYNRKQAAEVLQVSPPTLDALVREGVLKFCTIGENGPKRYRREDLESCLKDRNAVRRR